MKRIFQTSVFLVLIQVFLSCGISKSLHHKPIVEGYDNTKPIVTKISNTSYTSGHNFLLKNKQNLWELYVEGDPLQIGLNTGSLTDSILKKQENVFFSKIEDIIPSKTKQKLLRNFLKWYGRKLYLNIPEEYKTEIYGVSEYSSPNFDNIAPPYLRGLYLHSAHDIGHALQDLALVGCSSFAAWGDQSEDGSLIIGRNLDFYAGDDFAKDKIVTFVNPKQGHPFMTMSWAGMVGVCSGMNKEGLTVTINASKSKIPLVAKTPISLLTREILQYAKNIEEAIAIAQKRKVFVSESIMIGSAFDKKAILIEMSPKKMSVYDVPNSNQLICTNHFQSDAFKYDDRNTNQITNSHSKYRFDRITELLGQNDKLNPEKAVAILRNKDGLNNLPLGYGNEKAINQLLAHHGIIFKPEQRLVWVSSSPYQLGEFVCYDLNTIFNKSNSNFEINSLATESKNIPKDAFVETEAYRNYEKFRIEDQKMDSILKNKLEVETNFIKNYQSLNPDNWIVYQKVGQYFYKKKEYLQAKIHFEKALTKEITTLPSKKEIEKQLQKINKKLQ